MVHDGSNDTELGKGLENLKLTFNTLYPAIHRKLPKTDVFDQRCIIVAVDNHLYKLLVILIGAP